VSINKEVANTSVADGNIVQCVMRFTVELRAKDLEGSVPRNNANKCWKSVHYPQEQQVP
jgi:hypothetical protein